VNIDYGSKASAFDRIQVDALVRIATAAARMVKIGSTRLCNFRREKKDPRQLWGRVLCASIFSANMIVSTRVTTGSPFALWLLIQVDLEKDRLPLGFEGAKVVFFVWIVGVTEVIVDGYRLNDAFDCLLAECGDTGCS
jgi:hypothetical protein